MTKEPDPQGGALRRFRDPAYRPLAGDLAGIRREIDRIDDAVVRLLAERAMYVKDAARFKHDAFQVSAPARQAQVFAHVRALAARHNPAFNGGFEGLPEVVEAAYRALVAGYIASEQQYFGQTEPISPSTQDEVPE
ncbi:chorismate mutase [Caenimonas sedimenti]|uniref:chorismate mutase n=1 Tax=Caenimonas sedimenti TaxID=2596921 RepID=A0A562ZND7_9BURK|nr:chorismate mutase [Caenimonas sedimenti]TWO70112.1 chorismate mutase [Caenimonas sedimenti]